MKNSGICPKCGGREVISVPSADAYRTWKVGDPLPVGRYLCMRLSGELAGPGGV